MDPRPEPEQPHHACNYPVPSTNSSSTQCASRSHRSATRPRTSPAATRPPLWLKPATGLDPVVGVGAQAMDCLRLARKHHGDPALILKCTAPAAGMMRQSWAMRVLRVQAERRAREAAGVVPRPGSPCRNRHGVSPPPPLGAERVGVRQGLMPTMPNGMPAAPQCTDGLAGSFDAGRVPHLTLTLSAPKGGEGNARTPSACGAIASASFSQPVNVVFSPDD